MGPLGAVAMLPARVGRLYREDARLIDATCRLIMVEIADISPASNLLRNSVLGQSNPMEMDSAGSEAAF
jgi:hypothetical protein